MDAVQENGRQRLAAERESVTRRFVIGGHKIYLIVGLYADGRPGEIFIKTAKVGSTINGLLDDLSFAISKALQAGVPLESLANRYIGKAYEPAGVTNIEEIPTATSISDLVFRWLNLRFPPPAKSA